MRHRIFGLLAVLALAVTATASARAADDWHILPPLKAGIPPNYPLRIGGGTIAGSNGASATYFAVNADDRFTGRVERKLPLADWRGKRVRLTLRLKTSGDVGAELSAAISKSNNVRVRAEEQRVRENKDWQLSQVVLAVPENARDLVIDLNLHGRGTLWLDGAKLEAGNEGATLTRVSREDGHVLGDTGPINPPGTNGDYGGTANGIGGSHAN